MEAAHLLPCGSRPENGFRRNRCLACMSCPSSPPSLALAGSFILRRVTTSSQATDFTITLTRSVDPMFITPALLLGLGIRVSQLHRPESCGPSPGKTRPLAPPTYLYYRYQLHGDYWISLIFGSSSLHNGLLERFTTRLGGGFDYGFLQISHWQVNQFMVFANVESRATTPALLIAFSIIANRHLFLRAPLPSSRSSHLPGRSGDFHPIS